MSTDPHEIAPTYNEIQSRADYHLQEAARALAAQWPRWSGRQRPTFFQRTTMRRVARRIGRDRAILAAALDQPSPPSTDLERP